MATARTAPSRDMLGEEYWGMLGSRAVARFFMLAAIHAQPMHGYEIRKRLAESCGGCCAPTDAMIYPTIKELVDGGYIVCDSVEADGRRRNVCRLTEKGEQAYAAAARVWGRIIPHLLDSVRNAPGGEYPDEVATERCCG